MTLRRAVLALSLVAVAAPATASPSQSAVPPAASAPATAAPAQPTITPAPATPSSTSGAPVDPKAIAFDVSADHAATDSGGPKLLKYVIDFVPAPGQPGTSYSIDLGKPKAVQGSVITVPLTKLLLPGTYMAHVRAIGRGTQTATTTVGPFVITEKSAKTKAEYDKELRDRQHNKSKAPPTTPPDSDAGKDGKDGSKSNGKGGFWKKFYEKVVG